MAIQDIGVIVIGLKPVLFNEVVTNTDCMLLLFIAGFLRLQKL